MDLTRRFDPKGMRGWLTSFVCAFLMLGVVAAAVADLPEDHPRKARDGRGLSPAAGNVLALHQVDRNRVLLTLTDLGEVGAAGGSVAGGGFWLANTNQYIFSSGPNVGALTPDGQVVVAIGGPFSQRRVKTVAAFRNHHLYLRSRGGLLQVWPQVGDKIVLEHQFNRVQIKHPVVCSLFSLQARGHPIGKA